jgi:predicted house-cleaning noncanonical NTP pyrophosphatase (MazG superfamily)
MVKFSLKKLGRDKGLEGFKSQNIIPTYKFLHGDELREALKHKLIEEVQEICDAKNRQEMVAELADALEVINGLCKAYEINFKEVEKVKTEKYNDRGGFEKGLYIETLEMDETNPRVEHFRKSPDKYPEF